MYTRSTTVFYKASLLNALLTDWVLSWSIYSKWQLKPCGLCLSTTDDGGEMI